MTDNEKQQYKAWFSQTVDDCMSSLYTIALRLTNNSADADDLVTEAVAKAWKSVHLLQHDRFRAPYSAISTSTNTEKSGRFPIPRVMKPSTTAAATGRLPPC